MRVLLRTCACQTLAVRHWVPVPTRPTEEQFRHDPACTGKAHCHSIKPVATTSAPALTPLTPFLEALLSSNNKPRGCGSNGQCTAASNIPQAAWRPAPPQTAAPSSFGGQLACHYCKTKIEIEICPRFRDSFGQRRFGDRLDPREFVYEKLPNHETAYKKSTQILLFASMRQNYKGATYKVNLFCNFLFMVCGYGTSRTSWSL